MLRDAVLFFQDRPQDRKKTTLEISSDTSIDMEGHDGRTIMVSGANQWTFRAPTSEEAKEWVDALQKCRTPQGPHSAARGTSAAWTSSNESFNPPISADNVTIPTLPEVAPTPEKEFPRAASAASMERASPTSVVEPQTPLSPSTESTAEDRAERIRKMRQARTDRKASHQNDLTEALAIIDALSED